MKNTLLLALLFPFSMQAQLIIPSGTVMATTANADLAIQITGNLNNESSFNFSNTKLRIDLKGGNQIITGNFVTANLKTSNTGIKIINGNMTVTNQIDFSGGIFKPGVSGKLLFTGPADGVTGGNSISYCDGIFYSNGIGGRVFPVGINNTYTPIIFESITGEAGVHALPGANLVIDNVDVIDVYKDWYWEITTDALQVNSRALVSLNGLEAFNSTEGGIAVLQSTANDGLAINLGSSSMSKDIVTSRNKVTTPIIAIGKEAKVNIRIHDLITPFGSSGSNDGLFIENLHKYDYNKVTLLDRWGGLVNKWTDYTNDINYDFSKLSPGSYICIVEYGKNGESPKIEQQMVTVLKIN